MTYNYKRNKIQEKRIKRLRKAVKGLLLCCEMLTEDEVEFAGLAKHIAYAQSVLEKEDKKKVS